jgi:hypothetical protein
MNVKLDDWNGRLSLLVIVIMMLSIFESAQKIGWLEGQIESALKWMPTIA